VPMTGRHILVVEDDSFVASLLQFLLKRQGMTVTVLGDGRSAIDSLNGDVCFDAVLLDLRLPQVSGIEVLAALRQQPNWADTPVLVLSALDTGSEVASVLAAGANDYMSKPFNPEELLARLRRLLPAAKIGI
jgi:DNA-binding response OmpR family regulator